MKNFKLRMLSTAIAVGFASNVTAETATDTVDVYAGLAPSLELTCTDVHFGVWRVPVRDGGGSTTVTLTAGTFNTGNSTFPTSEAVTGNDTGVALSSNFDEPQVGTCLVSGSAAADGTTGTASLPDLSGAALAPITDVADYVFGTINIPTSSDPDLLPFSLTLSSTSPTINSGETQFAIAGAVTLPANITVGQYGGYKYSDSVVVTFNDGVGD